MLCLPLGRARRDRAPPAQSRSAWSAAPSRARLISNIPRARALAGGGLRRLDRGRPRCLHLSRRRISCQALMTFVGLPTRGSAPTLIASAAAPPGAARRRQVRSANRPRSPGLLLASLGAGGFHYRRSQAMAAPRRLCGRPEPVPVEIVAAEARHDARAHRGGRHHARAPGGGHRGPDLRPGHRDRGRSRRAGRGRRRSRPPRRRRRTGEGRRGGGGLREAELALRARAQAEDQQHRRAGDRGRAQGGLCRRQRPVDGAERCSPIVPSGRRSRAWSGCAGSTSGRGSTTRPC